MKTRNKIINKGITKNNATNAGGKCKMKKSLIRHVVMPLYTKITTIKHENKARTT